MSGTPKKALQRARRKARVRKKVNGTAARPRLSVFRSSKHIYVQVVDDVAGVTLASASTLSAELKPALAELDKRGAAKAVGALAAKRCAERDIKQVVFDRNGYLYTGRVAAVADGAREAGLEF